MQAENIICTQALTGAQSLAVTTVGTPYYFSPELCQSKRSVAQPATCFGLPIADLQPLPLQMSPGIQDVLPLLSDCAAVHIFGRLRYSNKVDVWSLGVILYELTMMHKPFEAKSLHALMKACPQSVFPRLIPIPDYFDGSFCCPCLHFAVTSSSLFVPRSS